MSGLKNSPFGKRLRASHREHASTTAAATDDDLPGSRTTPPFNPIFGISSTPSLSLDSSSTLTEHRDNGGSESPTRSLRGSPKRQRFLGGGIGMGGIGIVREYGDRFVPSKDSGDLRTSYHLMEEGGGGPSTPSKSRIIPSESDALKGEHPLSFIYSRKNDQFIEQANAIFNSILHTEVTPPSPRRSISPIRPTPVVSASASASASGTTLVPPSTPARRRLFTYNSPSTSNPATPTRRLDTPTDEAYSMSPVRAASRQLLESPRRQLRSVCKTPYRVLDAPELADDFYLNLVDWSSTNVLGVGLGSCVYLWTAHNALVSKLCNLAPSNDTISSVSWVQKGSTLAVGTLAGRLHIYDAQTLQLQRTYQQAHTQRIGALAWNTHVLSSGSRDKSVHHRDVREAGMRPFKRCAGHRQEVCGLKWSGDGGPGVATLASGGNDNKVCIWDLRGSRRVAGSGGAGIGSGDDAPGDSPLWKFHEHTAAVKALAWDPHVSGVLATGGGTQDKHIRFWNVINGSMLHELDTGSQVMFFPLPSHPSLLNIY